MRQSYATQCDRLRSSPEGDLTWIALISRAALISREELEQVVDLSTLLSDGETLDDFVCSDPCHRFYKSRDGDGNEVHFIMHSGFEFFFGAGGRWPAPTTPSILDIQLHKEFCADALAMALLGADDPRIAGAPNPEIEVERDGRIRIIHGVADDIVSHARLILEDDTGPVAGLRVRDGAIIDQIYTRSDRRREGLATELVAYARGMFGHLEFDRIRTAAGEALWASINQDEFYREPGFR